jgi:hypothetical protein
MRTREGGFSFLEVLLLLVIVGIVGCTSWFVYGSQKNITKTLDKSVNSSSSNIAKGVTVNVPKLKISFELPTGWNEPQTTSSSGSQQNEFKDSTGGYWTYKDIKISLGASSMESCPQGDGAPLSLFQGYYTKNGEDYANWCPKTRGVEQYSISKSLYPKAKIGKIKTIDIGDLIYIIDTKDCDGFWCDEPQQRNNDKIYSFASVFNVDTPPFAGGSFYYTYVGKDDVKVKLLNNSLLKLLASLKKTK